MKTPLWIISVVIMACNHPTPADTPLQPPPLHDSDASLPESTSPAKTDTLIVPEKKQYKSGKPTTFIIKDSADYSTSFLESFTSRHEGYATIELIHDTIIVDGHWEDYIIIPTDLPLNKSVSYSRKSDKTSYFLNVKRINYSTITYDYYELVKGKKNIAMRGSADLESSFYLGSEGTFEDENENTFGMNDYNDYSQKDCWVEILIGVGSIEKSQFIHGCENDRNKINSYLLKRLHE